MKYSQLHPQHRLRRQQRRRREWTVGDVAMLVMGMVAAAAIAGRLVGWF